MTTEQRTSKDLPCFILSLAIYYIFVPISLPFQQSYMNTIFDVWPAFTIPTEGYIVNCELGSDFHSNYISSQYGFYNLSVSLF